MAHVANRSPSPNPSRNQSPGPGAANAVKVVKKVSWVNPSFSKNAVFSSPSEIPQRNLSSKGGLGSSSLRASFENNENERDLSGLKLNKARSPAAAPSKGTKNFMSPTISASSKVIAASPKRKILSERNDDTRSSLTSASDYFDFVELAEGDPIMEMAIGNGPKVTLDTPNVLKRSSPERMESQDVGSELLESFDLQESLGSLEKKNRDSESGNDPSSFLTTRHSPVVASLDEGPTLPPYDPKTNYLSPRPRFLHYRPKPRIEHYLSKEEGFFSPGDGRQLEDRFSSESSEEDSEQTEEETPSSDNQNVLVIDSFSSEDHHPEPKTDHIISSKEIPKFHFSTRSRLADLFLLMVVACFFVSVIDTPVLPSVSVLKHDPFRNLYASTAQSSDQSLVQLKEQLNLNFDKLANKFKGLSISSIAHFRMLLSNFSVPRVDLGFFYLMNLTATEMDKNKDLKVGKMEHEEEQGTITDVQDVKAVKNWIDDRTEETEVDAAEYGMEASSSAEHGTLSMTKDVTEETEVDAAEYGLEAGSSAEQGMLWTEARNHLEQQPEENEDEIKEEGQAESLLDTNLNSLSSVQQSTEAGSHLNYLPLVIRDEVEKGPQALIAYDKFPSREDVTTDAQEDYGGAYDIFGPVTELPLQTMLGISSVVLALVAIIISLRVRQKHIYSPAHGVLSHSKIISDPISQRYMHSQSPFQSHPPEVETTGESGPSELSSSLHNSLSLSQKRSRRGKEQDFSHERNLRRDSVASSTSFGSFTTYERLSGKKGCQDEDALTPVRRSSRIRNQVTSP